MPKAVNNIEGLVEKLGVSYYRLFKETGIAAATVYHMKNHPDVIPTAVFIETVLKSYPDKGLEPSDFFKIVS